MNEDLNSKEVDEVILNILTNNGGQVDEDQLRLSLASYATHEASKQLSGLHESDGEEYFINNPPIFNSMVDENMRIISSMVEMGILVFDPNQEVWFFNDDFLGDYQAKLIQN